MEGCRFARSWPGSDRRENRRAGLEPKRYNTQPTVEATVAQRSKFEELRGCGCAGQEPLRRRALADRKQAQVTRARKFQGESSHHSWGSFHSKVITNHGAHISNKVDYSARINNWATLSSILEKRRRNGNSKRRKEPQNAIKAQDAIESDYVKAKVKLPHFAVSGKATGK